jgi:hypothetical protein
MSNKQKSDDLRFQAVDLHRRGETQKALSVLNLALAAADNDEQRLACSNEKTNLLLHLAEFPNPAHC